MKSPAGPGTTAVFFLCICAGWTSTGCTEEVPNTAPPPEVRFLRPDPAVYRPSVTCTGIAESRLTAEITVRTPGTVEEVCVIEGEHLKKGQVLIRMTNPELDIFREQTANELRAREADLAIAEGRLFEANHAVEKQLLLIDRARAEAEQKQRYRDTALTNLEHRRILHAAGGISDSRLVEAEQAYLDAALAFTLSEQELLRMNIGYRDRDIAAAGFPVPEEDEEKLTVLSRIGTRLFRLEAEAAAAEVERVRLELTKIDGRIRDLEVTAPIAGTAAVIQVQETDWAEPGTQAATILDVSELTVAAPVNEQHRSEIVPGLRVRLSLHPDVQLPETGTVLSVSPFIRTETRAVQVRIGVPGSSGLLPGEIVFAEILTGEEENRLLIPEQSSIHHADGGISVFTLDGGRLKEIFLKSPVWREEGYLTAGGLSAKDWICAEALEFYTDGMEVRPYYDENE